MARLQKKTIKNLLDEGKAKTKTIQSLGVQVPSLVNQFDRSAGGSLNNDALVYTVIDIIDEGTSPDGKSTPTKISYCLPPPIQIIDLHSANWEGVSFAEKIKLLNTIKSGGGFNDILEAGGEAVAKFIESFVSDTISGTGSKAKEELLRSRVFAGEEFYNLYSVGRGVAINPNIELAFRSANLRNMQLNFRLIPLSEQDANDMQKFMDRLKLMMYARSDLQWATGYPARFGVQVKTNGSGGGAWSNKILFSLGKSQNNSCVLTDFQVSYGEGGIYAGHYDGSPGVIDLNLTFQETTLSTRESILQEYDIKGI